MGIKKESIFFFCKVKKGVLSYKLKINLDSHFGEDYRLSYLTEVGSLKRSPMVSYSLRKCLYFLYRSHRKFYNFDFIGPEVPLSGGTGGSEERPPTQRWIQSISGAKGPPSSLPYIRTSEGPPKTRVLDPTV